MSVFVLGAGTAQQAELAALAKLGEFRKATPNMMLAYSAITAALGEVTGESALPKEEPIAMVLGSSYGELDVTQEFLATVGSTGVARPLLFQSSLHNATLGFLTLKLGITGPTFTVSSGALTGERALETAMALLEGGLTKYCLVVGVERHSPALAEPMALVGHQKDGAGALFLASNSNDNAALAEIQSVSYGTAAEGTQSLNHSDAIERLAEQILRRSSHEQTLVLRKSDGAAAMIQWKDLRHS